MDKNRLRCVASRWIIRLAVFRKTMAKMETETKTETATATETETEKPGACVTCSPLNRHMAAPRLSFRLQWCSINEHQREHEQLRSRPHDRSPRPHRRNAPDVDTVGHPGNNLRSGQCHFWTSRRNHDDNNEPYLRSICCTFLCVLVCRQQVSQGSKRVTAS